MIRTKKNDFINIFNICRQSSARLWRRGALGNHLEVHTRHNPETTMDTPTGVRTSSLRYKTLIWNTFDPVYV
jgi:hypothetical protein